MCRCLSWIGAAALFFTCMGLAAATRLVDARLLMGTVVETVVMAKDAASARTGIDAAYNEMSRLSAMMNHYDAGSVVTAINESAGARSIRVPPELLEVLSMAQAVSGRTGGAFDVTVGALRGWRFRPGEERLPPAKEIAAQRALVDYRQLMIDARQSTAFLARSGMRIDLGGIAKLYIVRAGLRMLARHGIERAMINAGGDVGATGGPGAPWRVGIRDPRDRERLLGVIELASGFVVSSGDYERFFVKDGRRYHHILDPRTGYPAEGPHGVTLVGGALEAANGLSVAIMVLGTVAGQRLIADTPGLDGLIVDRDGSLWLSSGMRARLHPVQ